MRRRRAKALPMMMMAELAFASWETIMRRSLLMARGACSPAEYQRMVAEKMRAATLSATAMAGKRGNRAILAPWHSRATANAKRLRKS
jgi:hypothetical protein